MAGSAPHSGSSALVNKTVVVGLGEVGRPLFTLLSEQHDVVGVDVAQGAFVRDVDVLHVCYPFQIEDFVGETVRYISLFRPRLTIIDSTVGIGTSRVVAERANAAVVNSPVRGKHARMLDDIRTYTKFIGALDPAAADFAARHFQSVGLTTKILPSPECSELAKLCETTYFGLLIAWAQEIERYCDRTGSTYEQVASFFEEIVFLPPVTYFPGVIGGHCVMPNIEILSQYKPSQFLNVIKASNLAKLAEADCREADLDQLTRSVSTAVRA